MKKTIAKDLILKAINLSAEWNNNGYVVLNEDGTLDATVWNNWKWETPRREIIAYVNGIDGFILKNSDYIFEIDPDTLLK